jgi:hypothetical protein
VLIKFNSHFIFYITGMFCTINSWCLNLSISIKNIWISIHILVRTRIRIGPFRKSQLHGTLDKTEDTTVEVARLKKHSRIILPSTCLLELNYVGFCKFISWVSQWCKSCHSLCLSHNWSSCSSSFFLSSKLLLMSLIEMKALLFLGDIKVEFLVLFL